MATHPVWLLLSVAWDRAKNAAPAIRARTARVPSENRMFVHGLGGLTTFMAARGILDLEEGNRRFIIEARDYHSKAPNQTLGAYVRRKVLEKGLRYNTIRTRIPSKTDRAVLEAEAERYRKAKDGE